MQNLTSRELQVLEQVAEGWDNSAIAHSLFLSLTSVSRLLSGIYTKLSLDLEEGTYKRVKAAVIYLNWKRSEKDADQAES